MEPNSPEIQGRYLHLDCGNWPYGCPQCLDHVSGSQREYSPSDIMLASVQNMRSEGSMEVNNVWKDVSTLMIERTAIF